MQKQIGIILLLLSLGTAVFYGMTLLHTDRTHKEELPARNNFFLQIKEEWRAQMHENSVKEAYTALIPKLPEVHDEPHIGAHILGELLYEEAGMNGLAICTTDYGFGCYHGFFNSAINTDGIEVLPQLDAACRAAYGSIDMRCQHGLGHGLLVYTGYENLSDALELCMTINSPKTGGCLNGVFMEYSFHTMEKPGEGFYRNMDDIALAYEPCLSIDTQFREACYQEQSHWWAKVFNNDFAMIGALCDQIINQEQKTACFQGVGETITSEIGFSYGSVLEICNGLSSTNAAELCRQGASWRYIGRGGEDHDNYIKLCDSLSGERRESCMGLLDAW